MRLIDEENRVDRVAADDNRIESDLECKNLNKRVPTIRVTRVRASEDSSFDFHLRESARVRTSMKKRMKEEE